MGTSPDAAALLASRTQTDAGSGCHIWTGAWSKDGYGVCRFAGRQILAHRLAMHAAGRRALGDPRPVLPCPLSRLCVNPDHLTLAERRRGGTAVGTRNARARLLEAEARRVLDLAAEGYEPRTIAARLSVQCGKRITRRMVKDILTGRTWGHLWRHDQK